MGEVGELPITIGIITTTITKAEGVRRGLLLVAKAAARVARSVRTNPAPLVVRRISPAAPTAPAPLVVLHAILAGSVFVRQGLLFLVAIAAAPIRE